MKVDGALSGYRPPRWLPGGHLQTIWAAKLARAHAGPRPAFERERWTTPDGDFIDVDFLAAAPEGAPLLVVFHGLEGSSASPNVLAFAEAARRRGWALAVPHFRGCSGELNHAPRAYHSGDHEEVGWILQRLRARTHAPLRAAGISLGGNALLRWAQEAGEAAWPIARAVASVSSPIDLAAAGRAIDSGWNRLVYARMFLATMKPRALERLARHPGLFDGARVRGARTITCLILRKARTHAERKIRPGHWRDRLVRSGFRSNSARALPGRAPSGDLLAR